MSGRPFLQRLAAFAGVILIICVLVAVVLPWLARTGYAGEVIQRNFEHDRDATALFYTESERTLEIIRGVE